MAIESAYQRIEYVSLAGASYIDTGINSAQDLEITCKFSTTSSGTLLFGSRTDASSNSLTFGYFTSSSFYVGFGGSTTSYSSTKVNLVDGVAHIAVLNNTNFTVDGISQTINNRGTFSKNYSLLLGTWANSSSPDSRYFSGKIYSFSIKKNNSTILDLIPCKRKSDSIVGFYDQINKQFYSSKTSTAFTGGPNMADSTTGITYKTIINKAISGFNNIQSKLNEIGASYTSAAGVTSAISAPSEKNPLSVDDMLLSDAFRKATLSLTGSVASTPTATVKANTTNTNVVLSSSSTAYKIEIVKDGVTNGSVSHSGNITKSGYVPAGDSFSQTSTAVSANVTAKTLYIQPGVKGAAMASTTAGSATSNIGTETTGLAYLSGTTNSGITTTAPTGTAGTNYYTIKPSISTSAGSATPKATIITEGYFKTDSTGTNGSATSISVSGKVGSTYYVSKLSSGTTTITSNASKDVTVGTLASGYYPLTAAISGSWKATTGGYLPKDGSVSLSASSATVGRIAALTTPTISVSSTSAVTVGTASGGYYPLTVALSGTISSTAGGYLAKGGSVSVSQSGASVGKIAAAAYSATSTNTATGFTASSTATSWYITSVGKATVSTAGYAPTGSKSGSNVVTYIPAATIKNGFTTVSGMVAANTANYVTQYNSTDKCVDIIFNS